MEDEHNPGSAGDAAACAAAIDAWLKQRAAAPEPDWNGVLGQMRAALTTLSQSALLRSDDRAQAILMRMVSAQDMDDLAADADLLADRVAELTGLYVGPGGRPPVLSIAGFEQRTRRTEDEDLLPARMVLRL